MNETKRIEDVYKITKELAHVIQAENLFVDRIRKITDNQFETEFTIDGRHPYLYENEAISNHVSGTTFLEATRQLCKAISHLYYGVPILSRFVLKSVSIDYFRWAKCGVPLYMHIAVSTDAPVSGLSSSSSFDATLTYSQEGYELGLIKISFSAISQEVEHRLMSRQYSKPPLLDKVKSVPSP